MTTTRLVHKAKPLCGGNTPLIFTTFPTNIKEALPNVWDKLTLDDFLIGATTFRAGTDPYGDNGKNFDSTFHVNGSYDQNTGVLIVSEINYKYNNTGAYYGQFWAYSYGCFAVYKGTVGGK